MIDHPVLPFDVHILQQDVIYKYIFLTMLDIPHSLTLLIELCIMLDKGTELQKGEDMCLFVGL